MSECEYFELDDFNYERCEIFGEAICDVCQFAPTECDICGMVLQYGEYDSHMEKIHGVITKND